MGFISILKKIGGVGEIVGKDTLKVAVPAVSVAATIDPALAPVATLVSGISRMVLSAHNTDLNNIDKKNLVLTMVESVSPTLLEMLVDKTGHVVTDEPRFAKGVDNVIEGLLDLYKSIGAIPITQKAATGA